MRKECSAFPRSLVGRLAEIDRIDRLGDGVSKGQSASLELRGEAGIGKELSICCAQEHWRPI
jgi:hypothetical protein